MKKIGLVVIGLVIGLVGLAQARDIRQLLNEEKAAQGATHVVMVEWSDLAGTTASNTAASIIFTNAIPQYAAVVGVRYELAAPFSSPYSGLNSCTLAAGVASATTNIMKTVEMALDGTEVYNKWGPSDLANYYTTATNIVVTITPNNTNGVGLSAFTNGQARVFLKIHPLNTIVD